VNPKSEPPIWISSEVAPRSYNRDPKYCLLSVGRNPNRQCAQNILETNHTNDTIEYTVDILHLKKGQHILGKLLHIQHKRKNKHLVITTPLTNTRFLTQYTHKARRKTQTYKNTHWTGNTNRYTHHNNNSYHIRTIPKK